MAKAKIFDVNEQEWKRDWDGGLSSCVMKLPPLATLQYWELPAGQGAAPHSHENIQLTYVQNGRMQLNVDDESYILNEGCFALIPANAVHSTKNVGSTTVVNIDFFLPDRDDREDSVKIRDFGHEMK
jgi:quercetin dioxygenase-like cupin family protein